MKVRRKTPEATAIKWDGSKLALARIQKLYKHIKVSGDTLIVTTLDSTIQIKPGWYFVAEPDKRIGGYSEENFNVKFEEISGHDKKEVTE